MEKKITLSIAAIIERQQYHMYPAQLSDII